MNIIQNYIRKNDFTRTGWIRTETKAIVLHWTATPEATAMGVRNWFDCQADGENPRYGSAQFVVGLDGEVVACMPSDEYARHVGSEKYTEYGHSLMVGKDRKYRAPNWTCVGIELCHRDWTGAFEEKTITAAQELVRLLLARYGLGKDAITTHKAVVGWKNCPLWFVQHPDELAKFIAGV